MNGIMNCMCLTYTISESKLCRINGQQNRFMLYLFMDMIFPSLLYFTEMLFILVGHD